MCNILKNRHPNSVFVDAVFKRIGVDRNSYFDGVPRKRVYVSKHKLSWYVGNRSHTKSYARPTKDT